VWLLHPFRWISRSFGKMSPCGFFLSALPHRPTRRRSARRPFLLLKFLDLLQVIESGQGLAFAALSVSWVLTLFLFFFFFRGSLPQRFFFFFPCYVKPPPKFRPGRKSLPFLGKGVFFLPFPPPPWVCPLSETQSEGRPLRKRKVWLIRVLPSCGLRCPFFLLTFGPFPGGPRLLGFCLFTLWLPLPLANLPPNGLLS